MDSIVPSDDTPRKQCPACKHWFDVTKENFHRNKRNSDGFEVLCKPCRNEAGRSYWLKHRTSPKPLREKAPDGYKRCVRCPEGQQLHPATLEFFPYDKNRKSGLYPHCKVCESKRQKALRSRPEEKEKQAKRVQRNYEENKEHYQERHRKWKRDNPEWVVANAANRRALERSVPGEHTPEQIKEQLKRQKHRCYYAACGFSKFPRVKENGKWKYLYHIEHTFPLSRVAGTGIPANDMGYIVLACESCNQSKFKKYPWEWPEGGRLL